MPGPSEEGPGIFAPKTSDGKTRVGSEATSAKRAAGGDVRERSDSRICLRLTRLECRLIVRDNLKLDLFEETRSS